MDYLIGHLVGDYLVSNDFLSTNKLWSTRKWAGLFYAMWHALMWTAAVVGCGLIAGRGWPPWTMVVMVVMHGIQDWTRWPTHLIRVTGTFDNFRKMGEYTIPEHSPNSTEILNKGDTASWARGIHFWGTIIVDNTWHLLMLFVLAEIWSVQ
jgi:hypothetical protein